MSSLYSVLMPVYGRDDPNHFRAAIASILQQTCPPSQLVLVRDGPVGQDLHEILMEHAQNLADVVTLLQLPENVGLGLALATGLQICRHDLVARMDSDDISLANRCERQVSFLNNHPDVDAVGSWTTEFSSTENPQLIRKVPVESEDIVVFAKRRNPLNHMTVMFRKSKVIAAGGYMSFPGFEDYHLWIRMILNGSRLANIPECLVRVRTDNGFMDRRGGVGYANVELAFQAWMFKSRFVTPLEFLLNCGIRSTVRLSPKSIRRHVYAALRAR